MHHPLLCSLLACQQSSSFDFASLTSRNLLGFQVLAGDLSSSLSIIPSLRTYFCQLSCLLAVPLRPVYPRNQPALSAHKRVSLPCPLVMWGPSRGTCENACQSYLSAPLSGNVRSHRLFPHLPQRPHSDEVQHPWAKPRTRAASTNDKKSTKSLLKWKPTSEGPARCRRPQQ